MKHNLSLGIIITYICIAYIIHGSGPSSSVNAQNSTNPPNPTNIPNTPNDQCCDSSNPNTKSSDCVCSDQTGGVGICICSSLPNTRQGWFCIKNDTNGDSVSVESKF